mmetsp:Transcript_116985/g.162585  ORF Transcript_116985/g.162585 Transcript_116985/m.162585 type:complete len:258 (+) Transcript_116985:24-797(+)
MKRGNEGRRHPPASPLPPRPPGKLSSEPRRADCAPPPSLTRHRCAPPEHAFPPPSPSPLTSFATIVKTIGSWSARRRPLSPPPPSPQWMKRSWTPPCRRSDRVKTTRPTRWAQEPASLARTPPRTERPRPACWQQPACRPHTPHPPQPHPAHLTHRTQDTPTNREGLRAWPLHSRGTALALARARGAGPAPSTPQPSKGQRAWHKNCIAHCALPNANALLSVGPLTWRLTLLRSRKPNTSFAPAFSYATWLQSGFSH